MNRRRLSLVCAVLFAGALGAAGQSQSDATEAERLVKQLSSPRFVEREAAFKALDALGPSALPALRCAAQSEDSEVRRRVGELIAKYEHQADSAAVFAPTKVHLKANNALLADILRDLSKQAQVRLQLAREPADLATRRVTLDTGETSFWEAIDALCRQAKVSIRTGAFDLSATDAPQAAGNVAWMVVTAAPRADETLVIQDGAPPAYPTAYLGAVRVRLVPDLWGNRDRGQGEEHRWTLEVLSEPRVTWQEPPGFQFDAATGLTLTPAAANRTTTAPAGVNFAVAGGGAIRKFGTELTAALRTVTRHELPINIKSDGPAGQKVPELKGVLAGKAQLAAETIAAVADVTKADAATAGGKDDAKLTVRDCQVNANGSVTLKVEVERPAAGGAVMGNVVAQQRIQIGGGAANVVQVMNNLGGTDEKLRLFDTQDRPYSISVSESSTSHNNGITVAKYTLECQPAGQGAQPRKLELHGPRWVSVEGRFVLRDVPRP